ncbi:hypothetical protein [Streptococcus suis]|uniref:hypothetical protein n=1 Tax=Streptococcus suis TaxID=1307 RepID=UPI001379F8C1|nr:hypothetical protein [Streptococcus suis]
MPAPNRLVGKAIGKTITLMGVGKNSTKIKRVRLPASAQLIRPDLECKTRTNLPINHCAEMLTRTLSSGSGLFAQPRLRMLGKELSRFDYRSLVWFLTR